MITHPKATFSEEKIYYFKYTFFAKAPKKFSAFLFADARYKLYLNGQLIAIGPCKGNTSDMYFDTIETSENLNDGENTLEAVVLQLKNEHHEKTVYANLCSVLRSGNMRFALKGTIDTGEGSIEIETDETWLTTEKNGISFAKDNANTVGMSEVAEEKYFSNNNFINAVNAGECVNYEALKRNPTQRGRYSLKPAPIPAQELKNINLSFDKEICDAGEYTTAFVKYIFSGKGKVKLTYSECRILEGENRKGNRTDANGLLEGYCDIVEINGESVSYEPFWFKSFRFIHAEIIGDVKIESVSGIQTGYPLDIQGAFKCSDETANKLWEISLRTLKCCMHETYEDCPYYEQLQYLMDSRLEILYSYHVSNDDRLARRLLNDFASNQQSDGMLRSRTPDILPQIIPGYSLYYIFIMFEHYERFADLSLIKSYMPVALNVLRYFSEHLSEKGLVMRSAFWDYVDWAEDWKMSGGSPLSVDREEISVYTFMYVAALKKAAVMLKLLGDLSGSNLLLAKSEEVFSSLKKVCFDDKKNLFADGPSKKYFSVHTQIWAVLSECIDESMAKTLMKNSFNLSTQPSYCYIYDYFRALEKCGLYKERKTMMNELLKLVSLNCTTLPEKPVNPRSECHAWNAVALYEFASSDLGVKVDEPNKTIYISPYIDDFDCAEGTVAIKNGIVGVRWKKENCVLDIDIESPKDYLKKVILSGNLAYEGHDNKILLKENFNE